MVSIPFRLDKPGFGSRGRQEIPYENYLEEFVVVTKVSGGNFGGRYIGISKEGNMIFNPHEITEYEKVGRRKRVVERDKEIKPSSVEGIEITTLENLREYCMYSNLDEVRSEQKKTSDYLNTGSTLMNQIFSIRQALKTQIK